MYTITSFRLGLLVTVLLILSVLFSAPIYAGNTDLQEIYTRLRPALENNVYNLPVYIESHDEENRMQGEIYGLVQHPFEEVHHALGVPDHWCDISPQHLNIKACTYQHRDNYCELTFYTGRKHYESPDAAYQIPYRFSRSDNGNGYFQVVLTANDGPMGTSDYRIEVEAIPIDARQTFVHFSYAYRYNFLTRLGMSTYLNTLGRNKIGFSVTGKDESGKPVFVEGVRGIIERNAVRYYLAIQSYLETLTLPANQRFITRLAHWFDLTERHHTQLYEMDKKDYLEYKLQEQQDQLRLQKDIDQRKAPDSKCRTE